MSVWTRRDFKNLTVNHDESIVVLRIPDHSASGLWLMNMELTEEAAEYLRELLAEALAPKQSEDE